MTTRALGPRLALGALAALALSVPVLLLALLVRDRWEPLGRLDRTTADRLNTWAITRPGTVSTLETLQTVLAPTTFRVLVVAAAVWLWVRGARRTAIWAVTALTVGGLLGVVLKAVVHRARPSFTDPVAHAGSYSFPSGHALNSMLGVAILLVALLPALPRAAKAVLWVVGVGVVLLTGWDRIALGVHYVSDVLAGWFVALAVVISTATAFETWRRDTGRGTTNPLSEGLEPAAQSR